MEDQASIGIVLRDMNLAANNQINGTPTLFINGRRLTVVKDKAELLSLITEAKQEALSTASGAGSN